jgi:hypothetical protein
MEEARDEAEALRRLLRLKARELKTLRRLGQEALLQRSEVEIFLVSSLHQASAGMWAVEKGFVAQGQPGYGIELMFQRVAAVCTAV